MLYEDLSLAFLLMLPSITASALPQQTLFTKSAAAALSGSAATTACPASCSRNDIGVHVLSWRSLSVTATITAETVILVVNGRTNVTSTTTITTAEIDLKTYTPATDLNSAGTTTTAIVLTNGHSVTTHTVAYPTTYYQDYPSSYTICGTLPMTISGVATCIEHPCVAGLDVNDVAQELGHSDTGINSGATSFTFPSHPPIVWPSLTMGDLKSDPKGLTYEPVLEWSFDLYYQLQLLFPDLGVWNCLAGIEPAPDSVKEVALYLTTTSTATEYGDVPSNLPIYTGTRLPKSEKGASQAPTVTSGLLPSKPEEAATILTETSSGNAPASKNAEQAISVNGVSGSKQAPPNPSADAATTSSGIANGNVPASAVAKISTTTTLGSEQVPSPRVTTTRVGPTPPTENPEQAPGAASVSITLSSTDEQGHAVSSVARLSAVGITSTNPQGSLIATTLPGVEFALGSEAAPIILNSHTIPKDADALYLVSGQPLTPGTPVTLGSGAGVTPIAIHTSRSQTVLLVGSSASTLAPLYDSAAVPAVIIGTQALMTNPENRMAVGTQTLAPGVAITLGSGDAATPVVIHTSSSHTILIVGSSTSTLLPTPTSAAATALAAAPAPTIGSQILAPNSEGQYVVGSQTLTPGLPVTLGSGNAATPVLLQTTSSNTVLIIGSSTSTLKAAAATAPRPITIGSQFISVNSQNQYVVGSQTLALGSPITLGSGAAATPVLLQTTGSQTVLVAGSITSTLAAAVTAPPPITIGSQVVTANAEDQYVVNSQTLTPGGAITVSGTQVSLAPSGTQVVVGTSTEALGNYIMSGLGAGPSGSASGALPFTGAARRQVQSLWRSVILGSGVVGFLVWL